MAALCSRWLFGADRLGCAALLVCALPRGSGAERRTADDSVMPPRLLSAVASQSGSRTLRRIAARARLGEARRRRILAVHRHGRQHLRRLLGTQRRRRLHSVCHGLRRAAAVRALVYYVYVYVPRGALRSVGRVIALLRRSSFASASQPRLNGHTTPHSCIRAAHRRVPISAGVQPRQRRKARGARVASSAGMTASACAAASATSAAYMPK